MLLIATWLTPVSVSVLPFPVTIIFFSYVIFSISFTRENYRRKIEIKSPPHPPGPFFKRFQQRKTFVINRVTTNRNERLQGEMDLDFSMALVRSIGTRGIPLAGRALAISRAAFIKIH